MAVITPTPIDAGPAVPISADSETTFDAAYEAFNAWEKNKLQPQANALADNVFHNANESAIYANKAILYAGQALDSKNSAEVYAANTSTKATEAALSAQAAELAKTAAVDTLDAFDDRYLGSKSSNPSTDNDGSALLVGALYFRTTAPIGMKVWTGTAWDDAYANLSSKFDKAGGTISGATTVQVNSDSAAGLLIENTNTGGINTAAALLFKAGPTVAAQIAMQRLTSTLVVESLNASDIVISTGGSVLRIGAGTGTRVTGGALGYGVGAGGTVTQATSKSTAVTLNKPTGEITMNAAPLAPGARVSFTVNCTFFAVEDAVYAQQVASNSYRVEAYTASGGLFGIRVTNVTDIERAEALQIRFVILKGASA